MNNKKSKNLIGLLAFAVANMGSFLFADEQICQGQDSPCCSCPSTCFTPFPSCTVPCPDPCCSTPVVFNHNINPPARCTSCNTGIFVTAEYLWWKVDEVDFGLAFDQRNRPIEFQVGANAAIVRFHYPWKSGFRVGLGWNTPYDGWDIYANYTWFHNHTSKRVSEPIMVGIGTDTTFGGTTGIYPFWQQGEVGALGDTVKYSDLSAHWHFRLNIFDLEIGRDFAISCGLSLRPFFGVEGGWITRRWDVTFSNDNSDEATFTLPLAALYKNKSNYWGAGPRVGIRGNWGSKEGFYLFGNIAGSILKGKVYANKAVSQVVNPPTAELTGQNTINDKQFLRAVPHLQVSVGMGLGRCFHCQRLYTALQVGFEDNHYWNVPQVIYPGIITLQGSGIIWGVTNRQNRSHHLGISGLTVNFTVEF